MGKEQETIFDKLVFVDVRIVYALMLVVIAIPIIFPLGLPLTVGPHTQTMYDAIEAVPEDKVVFMAAFHTFSGISETGYTAAAMFRHMLSKGVKSVWTSFSADADICYRWMLDQVKPEEMGYTYGEDWAYLGFLAGSVEAGTAALAVSVWDVFPTDWEGTPVSTLPIMAECKTYEDWDFAFFTGTVTGTVLGVVRQWGAVYNIPLYSCTRPITEPLIYPFYPHRVRVIMSGTRSAAEYEKLLDYVGPGLKAMDVMSTALWYIIVLVIFSNVMMVLSRLSKGGTKE
jgi:hypothetical protein